MRSARNCRPMHGVVLFAILTDSAHRIDETGHRVEIVFLHDDPRHPAPPWCDGIGSTGTPHPAGLGAVNFTVALLAHSPGSLRFALVI